MESFFVSHTSKVMSEINLLKYNFHKNNKFDFLEILNDLEKNPVFKTLKDELTKIPVSLDAHEDFYNQEVFEVDKIAFLIENNNEIYAKNILSGQKILIVMLWTASINPTYESEFIVKIHSNSI